MRKLLLGVDAGQTVTKAVLFDAAGRQVAKGSIKVPLHTPRPCWVERDMHEVWLATQQAIRMCLAEGGVTTGREVAAVGLSGHNDGLYAVDEHYEPVRPAIVAMDTRAHTMLDRWRDTPVWPQVLELSGQVPFAASPAAVLAWWKTHEPAALERSRWLMFCKDWLRLKLTGEVATDPTEASASFTDVHTHTYSPQLLELYGLGELSGKLPPVLPCDAVAGHVTAEAAAVTGLSVGTPVVTGAHDVDAAAIGIGGTAPGDLCLIAGTFSVNQVVSDRVVIDPRWQVRNFVRPHQWMSMSTSPASVASLEWFLRVVGVPTVSGESVYDVITREVGAQLAGPSEVLFHPFVYGSPHSWPASGTFLGLRGWHTRGHLLRALLEGVVLNHRWHVDALSSALPLTGVTRLTGGAARSEIWAQMFSDALNRPVEVPHVDESAARGAALLAGTAIGLLAGIDDARALTTGGRCYEPEAGRVAVLDETYQVYLAAIDALGPVWSRLAAG
ncbi:carbohydrate kinase [Streptomyces decoyicus]|uniref:FGGY-family carbohydrate kinase n=1 Tax=Streptomyces decoyicus TaxID=249567 RepID=UPI002E306734|nr:FGGY-family carbohydrate kinase [Streptomyces decoyicus]